MTARRANSADLAQILDVYACARAFMKANKNPDQWGDIYPPKELVEQDIKERILWVIEDSEAPEDEKTILGAFAFFPHGDPIYNNIEGKWLNDLPHAAIHRVASSGKRRGILGECIKFCLSNSCNLKIDTHQDNIAMQNALAKQGFTLCGKIFLENGEERLAYQKYAE